MKILVKHEQGLQKYLSEIGKVPLLTKEEEETLANLMHGGDDSARQRLICANLRLVVKIAKEYITERTPLADLVAEGNIGLIKAIERFDPAKGRLATYAVWWIRLSIRQAIHRQARVVRLPMRAFDKMSKIMDARASLKERFGREPEVQELSLETKFSLKQVRQIMEIGKREISLDAPVVSEEEAYNYGDSLPDENAISPLDWAISENLRRELPKMLLALSDRERKIIFYKFNFFDDRQLTLEQIGEKLNLTRERVRQLIVISLQKMKKVIQDPPRNELPTLSLAENF